MSSGDDGYSRRDFLWRLGQTSAFALLSPALRRGTLWAEAPEFAATGTTSLAAAAMLDGALRWRLLGPFRGGRVDAASGVPGRPNEFYFGAVNGGVWKTIDGGRVWRPVFDGQPVASIGALAVAPSAPDTVYVGSGESTLRDSAGYGNGVYRSTDGGRSWTHLGLADTHHIGKIAIDPRDPNVVFVAAIGQLYAANPERGVFRSRNGGASWEKVLFKGPDVGAVEVVIDPTDSRVIYAGLWNTRRPPWFTYAPTNGPGGGIFKSVDGGSTWTQLTAGLPAAGIGRTGIAVAPSSPRRVYAVVDCLVPDANAPAGVVGAPQAPGRPAPPPGQGGVFRSDDAGATWTKLSGDQALWGRGWYFEKIVVDPTDADVVYVPNVAVSRTMDGGRTWSVIRGSPGGDDYHQAWISATDPDTMIVASDQGAVITRNAKAADAGAVTWSSWLNQPTAQLYHCSVDHRFPYWVTGAQQDSGAVAVRSRGKFAEISIHDWEPIGAGGESGMTAGDPQHPGVVYGGNGQRWDLERNLALGGTTTPNAPEPARTDWTAPLVLSKSASHALYYANQFLFRSTDGAKTWTRISGDLTRPDPGIPATLDAAAAAQVDRNGKRGVIYTIAPSPLRAPLLWIGTDDGLIHRSADDGATWRNVTPAAIGLWSRITTIEASPHDPASAYASVDRHQLQDYTPYIFRTRDDGRSWQRITNGLPAGVYVHVVRADPVRRGLLFAGTERGAFVSLDDGDSWQSFQLDLPVTSVRDFEIYRNDLIVATHGRGIYVVDDISALRQLDDAVVRGDAYLFAPADTVDFQQGDDNGTPFQMDEPRAENPPEGAMIDYWLRTAPANPVTIEILDAAGSVVRTFSSDPAAPVNAPPGRGRRGDGIPNVSPQWQSTPRPLGATAGAHRVAWTPVTRAERGPGGGRGGEPRRLSGAFTVRLTVDGKRYERTLRVLPDPRLAALPG